MAVIPGFSIQHGKVISATLIVAVTGLILNPTLSVPLQLFPAPWMVVAVHSMSPLQNGTSGRLPAPAIRSQAWDRNRIATSVFFFSILPITGIVADLFKYSLSFVFTGRTGLLAWSISRRNCFAVEMTNDSSAPLGCCDHFTREHVKCRAQASESLTVLI